MNLNEYFIYLIIMVGVTYLIRVIPFVAIRKKIKNNFILSFLYYIPYTVLASMILPASLFVTGSIVSSICGLVIAVLFSLKGKSLTFVAAASCLSVLIIELLMLLINNI